LVAKHGTFILGRNYISTLKKAIALEECAKLNYNALLLSNKITPLATEDVEIMHNFYINKYANKIN